MNNNTNSSKKKCGIYKITNTINGKVYIGQSVNLNKRMKSHLAYLKANKHHNNYLQNSFNKYGVEAFVFEVIKLCAIKELDNLEMKYILEYNSTSEVFGYNLVEGGQKYRFFTEDVKKKMSLARKGKKLSEQHKKRIGEGHKGKKMSLSSIAKGLATRKQNGSLLGEKNGNALIPDTVACNIIAELIGGKDVKCIVKNYNVTSDVVYNIMYNKSYTHLMTFVRGSLKNRTTDNLNKKVDKAVEMYKSGYSQNKIAKELNISRNTLRKELIQKGIDTTIHVNQFVTNR